VREKEGGGDEKRSINSRPSFRLRRKGEEKKDRLLAFDYGQEQQQPWEKGKEKKIKEANSRDRFANRGRRRRKKKRGQRVVLISISPP